MKRQYILTTVFSAAVAVMTFTSVAHAEWTVDFSRRTREMRKQELNPNYVRESSSTSYSSSREPASVRTFEGEVPPVDESTNSANAAPIDAQMNTRTTKTSFIDRVFDPGEPSQDIVILNTAKGFVPNTIRIRKDGRYTVHVVNVNEKEKNVSFILDGFSEHHATFFGKVKSFKLEPRKEGVYSFLSPETAVEGKFIVFGGPSSAPTGAPIRVPATAQVSGVPVSGEGY